MRKFCSRDSYPRLGECNTGIFPTLHLNALCDVGHLGIRYVVHLAHLKGLCYSLYFGFGDARHPLFARFSLMIEAVSLDHGSEHYDTETVGGATNHVYLEANYRVLAQHGQIFVGPIRHTGSTHSCLIIWPCL